MWLRWGAAVNNYQQEKGIKGGLVTLLSFSPRFHISSITNLKYNPTTSPFYKPNMMVRRRTQLHPDDSADLASTFRPSRTSLSPKPAATALARLAAAIPLGHGQSLLEDRPLIVITAALAKLLSPRHLSPAVVAPRAPAPPAPASLVNASANLSAVILSRLLASTM
ncbi:LOW QUALITY PROTEIN: hypothetical protein CVT26_000893 [Gymnopilus dilepis]|uniref:Uncharacterized protein n=1 Tax=Gymnopilus dilepis TaxID=231916 RepID=A0A409WB90_9AGAR|nr:LOW QUALITY PROTEIN: hypothetical protein CVT26_000893 [Gymnopilus dilepis]